MLKYVQLHKHLTLDVLLRHRAGVTESCHIREPWKQVPKRSWMRGCTISGLISQSNLYLTKATEHYKNNYVIFVTTRRLLLSVSQTPMPPYYKCIRKCFKSEHYPKNQSQTNSTPSAFGIERVTTISANPQLASHVLQ